MNVNIKIEDPKFKLGDYIKFPNRCIAKVYDYSVNLYSNFSLKKNRPNVENKESFYILVVQESYCDSLKPSDVLFFSDLKVHNVGEKEEYTGKEFEPNSTYNYIKEITGIT
jgi:hypothetical protein